MRRAHSVSLCQGNFCDKMEKKPRGERYSYSKKECAYTSGE